MNIRLLYHVIFMTELFFVRTPSGTAQRMVTLFDWKAGQSKDGIEISYRDVMIADTFETRVMRIEFSVDAAPQELILMFREPDLFVAWSAGLDVGKEVATTVKNGLFTGRLQHTIS